MRLELTTPEWGEGYLEQWAEARRGGIGASEAAAALGWPEAFKDPLQLWGEKTGQLTAEAPDAEVRERFYWGHRLERVITEEVERRTGLQVRSVNLPALEAWEACSLVADCGELGAVYASNGHHLDFMRATPDGFLRVTQPMELGGVQLEAGTTLLLEIKTSSSYMRGKWDEAPPEHYLLQVWHSMAVFNLQHALVAALIGGQELRCFLIERLPEDSEKELVAGLASFWQRVQSDQAPEKPKAGSEEWGRRLSTLKRLHPDDDGEPMVLEKDLVKLLKRRETLQQQIKQREQEVREIEAQTRETMGGKAIGVSADGKFACTLLTTERKGYTQEVKPSKFRTLKITTPSKEG
jgi:predicted phage-related endonuclease